MHYIICVKALWLWVTVVTWEVNQISDIFLPDKLLLGAVHRCTTSGRAQFLLSGAERQAQTHVVGLAGAVGETRTRQCVHARREDEEEKQRLGRSDIRPEV